MKLTLVQAAEALLLEHYCGNCCHHQPVYHKGIINPYTLADIKKHLCNHPSHLIPVQVEYFHTCDKWEAEV